MSFKNRMKNIERLLLPPKGVNEWLLLQPGYKYKGKPFDSIDEMREKLNCWNMVPYYTNTEIIQLIENGLLSSKSKEFEELRKEASRQMRESL